jgi:hypothetical protein
LSFSISLVRGGKLGRAEAQACFSANLGLPGAGSLMAGRRSGYVQVMVALAGMGLTLVFGILFLAWCIQNLEQIRAPEADPYVTLAGIWRQLRWALLGIGLFVVAWLWALVTSFAILKTSPRG